ncbi:conjugal transfer protein TraH [Shewanella algicola]|uniref:conjugal transfer protein TraH n=1 Tax=Shewanella algicola TaxID=640633 RepID=UPI0024959F7C|nr:conjugal transfer protein TraH [Shewanella algicola]
MTLCKLSICIALTIASTFATADPMQDVFNDMYSKSAPSVSQHGNGRYGVNLGGFSYRPNIGDSAPIVSTRLPNYNIGACGDIDIFAGSFSFISGDELAQLSRAVMQGAATYAFKLALQSMSPMAAGIVDELTTLVNGMNEFNIDGCEQGAQWAEDALGSGNATSGTETGFVANKLKSVNVALGFSPDQNEANNGATSKKSVSELAEQVGTKIAQNSLINPIAEANPKGFLFDDFGGVKENELVFSILGATVTTTDSSMCTSPIVDGEKTCVTYVPGKGAEYFTNFFFNAEAIDSDDEDIDIKYYKCADNQCLSLTETTVTVKQLLPKLRKQIYAIWKKTYNEPDADYTDEESKLMYWFGNDMYLMMKTFGATDEFGASYAKYKSIEATAAIMDYMAYDMISQVKKALTTAETNHTIDEIYPVGLAQSRKDINTFASNYDSLRHGDIQKRIEENRANLVTNLSILLSSRK